MDIQTTSNTELLRLAFGLSVYEAQAAERELFRSPGELVPDGHCVQEGLFNSFGWEQRLTAARELDRRAADRDREKLLSPESTYGWLNRRIGHLEYEVFVVVFLDAQNKVIHLDELFRGTTNQTSVYPREVVKKAILHNASSVLLSHNHPSGELQPSRSDEALTQSLKSALQLVDVRVIDHVIVNRSAFFSFANSGLL